MLWSRASFKFLGFSFFDDDQSDPVRALNSNPDHQSYPLFFRTATRRMGKEWIPKEEPNDRKKKNKKKEQ